MPSRRATRRRRSPATAGTVGRSRRRGRIGAVGGSPIAGDRWCSLPAGDGSIRRRPSDVVKLVTALVVLALLVAAIRADLVAAARLVDDVVPPPQGLHWLVSAAVVPRLARDHRRPRRAGPRCRDGCAWRSRRPRPASGTWAVCGLLGALLGTTGGYPAGAAPAGVDPAFPVARLAAAMAVASVTLPYLSRPVRRLVLDADRARRDRHGLAGVGPAARRAGQPGDRMGRRPRSSTCASARRPGFPSAVRGHRRGRRGWASTVESVSARPDQEWGLARFDAIDAAGRPVEVSMYGRDASDAQLLAKLWRFVWYRDSGPTLALTRLQQVEHEAYLTLLAGHAGVAGARRRRGRHERRHRRRGARDPTAAGSAARRARSPTTSTTPTLDAVFAAVAPTARRRGIAHGAISGESVLLAEDGSVSLRDLRRASSGASADRLERDMAAAVVTVALVVGPERAVAAAIRSDRGRPDGRHAGPPAASRLRQGPARPAARPQGAAGPAPRGRRGGRRASIRRSWPRSTASRPARC